MNIKTIEIEAKTLVQMVNTELLPIIVNELKHYGETYNLCGKLTPKYVLDKIKEVSNYLETINTKTIQRRLTQHR